MAAGSAHFPHDPRRRAGPRAPRPREHGEPHSILGAHPADGGVVVRAYRPGAAAVRALLPDGESADLELVHPGGVFEGVVRGGGAAARLPARGRLRRVRHRHDRRPLSLPADHRRARPAPRRRGPPRGAVEPAGRARARDRGRAGDGVRGVGAVGPRGVRGRRLQLLGRARPPDALARLVRDLGAVPARRRRRGALQVRDPRAGRRDPPEGRSGRVRLRGAAQDRVGRAPVDARVGRRGVARAAERVGAARRADVDLRGPPRLVAAEPARGQPLAHLPRAGRRAVRLRARHGLHAHRAAAGDGAPVRRLVGLPGDRLLRAHAALRLAGRLQGLRRPPARERDRRDPRLGARALPARRLRARPVRRHARCTSTPTRAAAPIPTGGRWSSTTAATRSATSSSPTPCTGCASTTPTASASTPSPRCSTSTTRARRASGCRTSTAATRTSTRSSS